QRHGFHQLVRRPHCPQEHWLQVHLCVRRLGCRRVHHLVPVWVCSFCCFSRLCLLCANKLIQQCRVPGPHPRAARVGLQPAQPCQGLPPSRQGYPRRRRQGRREGC